MTVFKRAKPEVWLESCYFLCLHLGIFPPASGHRNPEKLKSVLGNACVNKQKKRKTKPHPRILFVGLIQFDIRCLISNNNFGEVFSLLGVFLVCSVNVIK